MSINLIESVQQNLDYAPLKKIDPNTATTVSDTGEFTTPENKFAQAAIPAVLTALFNYVQSDEGATAILQQDNGTDWVSKIFDEKKQEVVQTISNYDLQASTSPVYRMNEIAAEAVKLVKENCGKDAGIKEVKLFFKNQVNTILLYLPPELHLGSLLQHDALDDSTNKMEGPISSMMKSIGSAFSTPVTDDEIKEQ